MGWTLAGMVSLAFAIWLLDLSPRKMLTRRVLTILGIIVIALSVWNLRLVVTVQEDRSGTEAGSAANFQPYDAQAFEQTLQTTESPVFVNMTAAWCITCLVNEKVVLNTPEARALFAERGVVYFKGDWTNRDEAITAFLQHYGRSGVPIYVYFGPRDPVTGQRPQGRILPQILTIQDIQGLFPEQPATTDEGEEG